jgi:Zn-dependent protease with chaperone function
VAIAAAMALAAASLWQSKVPGDLHLPNLDPRDYFRRGTINEAAGYERFLRIDLLLSQVVLVGVLVLYARRGERLMRESAAGRIGTGMLLGMLGLALVWLAQLPFGAAAIWWERRHDISEIGYFEWVIESFFGLGNEFIAICLLVLVAMTLAGLMRRWWWVAAAVPLVAVVALATFVQPYLLIDLHNLESRRLSASAREIAKEQDVAAIPVKVQEVKEFTDAPNAEAVGLGPSRRVILWDTLVDDSFKPAEIESVIAHELAHHSRNHLWKWLGWLALFSLPIAFVVALATRPRGGMYEARAVPVALLVFVVLQIVSTPLQNVISRRMEAEADWIALETTRDPTAARAVERRLASESLTDPDPPGWAHILLDTHPTTIDRIAMVEEWADRNRSRRQSGR